MNCMYHLILILIITTTIAINVNNYTDRAIRDDETCAEKYGADWAEYKRQVPYMFIPGVV